MRIHTKVEMNYSNYSKKIGLDVEEKFWETQDFRKT